MKKINKYYIEDEAPTEDKDKPVSFIMDTNDLVLKSGKSEYFFQYLIQKNVNPRDTISIQYLK